MTDTYLNQSPQVQGRQNSPERVKSPQRSSIVSAMVKVKNSPRVKTPSRERK